MECKEVAAKTVRVLKIFENEGDGPEIHIEFTDGTIFSLTYRTNASVAAKLYRDEGGEPRVLHKYPLTARLGTDV